MQAKVYDCKTRTMADGRLAVGGQQCYPDGPSGLLTVYQCGEPMAEVQITEQLAEELSRLLVERTRSWISGESEDGGEAD